MKTYGFCNSFSHLNKSGFILITLVFNLLLLLACVDSNVKQKSSNEVPSGYLNHSDTARYVGMKTCQLCHQSIFESFIKTGMGQSFAVATKTRSAADFGHAEVKDPLKNFSYRASWINDSLFIHEYRLAGKDTAFTLYKQVNYIVGSGQHTNSHMCLVNGYLYQMPMTFYTQKGKWDLPPGFENGVNTRFSRKIGLECMSCHNAYPEFVKGSENKYTSLPSGIDCERCHGPGSIHVAMRSSGSTVDTSRYIDYSIVNPSKLMVDLQFDICQRCHLQGNTVLKEGKSFYDFKPGQKLSDVMTVFLPKYKNAEDEFIMASHADRLKESKCFLESYNKSGTKNLLKPYRDALTCITCHNPHLSVKSTQSETFDKACTKCHSQSTEVNTIHKKVEGYNGKNCFSCHMPLSGSTDIPHVRVHDHRIGKPLNKSEKDKIKLFLGLFAINEKSPDPGTIAKAYLNQYDKFEENPAYLDSANRYLTKIKNKEVKAHVQIQIFFTQGNYNAILQTVNTFGLEYCLTQLISQTSYDNFHAWTAYRIGEAYFQTGNIQKASACYKRAVELAPFVLDFRNKLGTSLAMLNRIPEAKDQYRYILKENPGFVSAASNLGYLMLLEGNRPAAKELLFSGLKLDPDNESLLLNLASYYGSIGQNNEAEKFLRRVLNINKNNLKALQALKSISTRK